MNKENEKKLSQWDEATILAESLKVPEISWLSPDYSLPSKCADFNGEPRIDDIKLFKLDMVTFEKEYPRQEALENVIASMQIPGINLIFLVVGEKGKVSFYYGVSSNNLYQEDLAINLKISAEMIQHGIQGNFRGSILNEVKRKELNAILKKISDKSLRFACLDGVPGVNQDKEKQNFQGIDRLVDVMMKDEFGFMIVATPIISSNETCNQERNFLEKSLVQVYHDIVLQSKIQFQYGKNDGVNDSTSNTFGTNESLSEGVNTSDGTSIAWSKADTESENFNGGESTNNSSAPNHSNGWQRGTSWAWTRNDSKNTGNGQNVTISQGTTDSLSRQNGKSSGSSRTVSLEIMHKGLQAWQEFFDKILYPRLDYGKGKGLFVCSTLLFSPSPSILEKLAHVSQSVFAGDSGNFAPLQLLELSSTSPRLRALQAFQQPLLNIHTSERDDCFAATVRSKCMHFKNGKPHDFYAGSWLSTKELSRLAGIPQREVLGLSLRKEVEFGLNIVREKECESSFDATKESTLLPLGKLVQSGATLEETDVNLDKSEFDRHIFVAGVTGGGKTYTCKWLLTNANWPFLVIEPAKTEYRELVRDYKDVLVFTLGDEKVAPFRLNPLEFTKGESIPSRVDMLMASITAAFDMEAAIPQIIEQSIYRSYEEYGWNIKNNKNVIWGDRAFDDGVYAFPTLGDVVKNSEAVVREKNFGQELGDRYLGSVRARLEGLLVGAKGMMLNCKRSIDFKELLGKKVVLELEEIRNGSEKSLIIGFILTNLLVAIKQKYNETGKKINHFTLVEEAHRLMTKFEPGEPSNKKNAVETFADMLAEIRKYGESMIIADQIPNKLTPEVLKNTNIKIVHRLFAKDDKEVIGSTMALDDDQKSFLSSLKIGHAVVFSGNWTKAMHVKVNEFKQSLEKRSISEISDELRYNALNYYIDNRARGIFPGLDILHDSPDIDFMEKYIETIQNEDLRGWFDALCEVPSNYDNNGRKKNEHPSRPFDLDEDSPILLKLKSMVNACGLDVVSRALVVTYMPSGAKQERQIEVLKQVIHVQLETEDTKERNEVWEQSRKNKEGTFDSPFRKY